MGNPITVDVVIPNYNRISELERALASLKNQKYIARIIIVDDGSNLETQVHYLNLTSIYPNIEILRYPHTGDPGYLRKMGVSHSSSEWIAFLDSDDEWVSDKIQIQIDFALEQNLHCVCSNAWNIKAGVTKQKYFDSSTNQILTLKKLLKSNTVITSTLIAKKEVLESIDFFAYGDDVTNSEDYATWLRIIAIDDIGFLDLPLVNYFSSETSFSRNLADDVNSKAISNFRKWLSLNEQLGLLKRVGKRIAIFIIVFQVQVTNRIRKQKHFQVFKEYL